LDFLDTVLQKIPVSFFMEMCPVATALITADRKQEGWMK
jgi:hypothetical protein